MVRSFRSQPVDEALTQLLLRQALAGPSAGNAQAVEFLVLEASAVGEYWDITLPTDRRDDFNWPGLLRAPTLIVPYVDSSRYLSRYSEPDKVDAGLGESAAAWPVPYWWVDAGAAIQTLLLGAAALRLGACFFGQFENESAVMERFGVPARFRAVGTVALGHPDRARDRPSISAQRGRRPFAEVVHQGRW